MIKKCVICETEFEPKCGSKGNIVAELNCDVKIIFDGWEGYDD
jgi:hypothetical protein